VKAPGQLPSLPPPLKSGPASQAYIEKKERSSNNPVARVAIFSKVLTITISLHLQRARQRGAARCDPRRGRSFIVGGCGRAVCERDGVLACVMGYH